MHLFRVLYYQVRGGAEKVAFVVAAIEADAANYIKRVKSEVEILGVLKDKPNVELAIPQPAKPFSSTAFIKPIQKKAEDKS